jgi:hypothetical protein
MIVCQESGEFKAIVMDYYKGKSIECCIALESGGFLIGFENSFIVYRTSNGDPKAPLAKIGEKTSIQMATNEPNLSVNSIKI